MKAKKMRKISRYREEKGGEMKEYKGYKRQGTKKEIKEGKLNERKGKRKQT